LLTAIRILNGRAASFSQFMAVDFAVLDANALARRYRVRHGDLHAHVSSLIRLISRFQCPVAVKHV
jgi:hypothetical protein